MRKSIVTLLFVLLSVSAEALEWKPNLTVMYLRMDGSFAYLATDYQPAETCNLWGEYMLFDYKTETGKLLYSTLLSAKAASQKIDVWYTPSTAPDTNQTSGCNANSAAVLTGVRVR